MKTDDYSFENLKKMTYIECVEKEVTRFYGPVSVVFAREVKEDHYFKGVPIKKSDMTSIDYTGSFFSEKYYKNPTEFRPERWIEECKQMPTYTVGGFGGGARGCIGKSFARLQAKIGLIKFMKRYSKIELPKNDFMMELKFFPTPEPMDIRLVKSE